MFHSGVNALGGSNAVNPYVFPGFSIYDELESLAEAGLSPLEALQTATITLILQNFYIKKKRWER